MGSPSTWHNYCHDSLIYPTEHPLRFNTIFGKRQRNAHGPDFVARAARPEVVRIGGIAVSLPSWPDLAITIAREPGPFGTGQGRPHRRPDSCPRGRISRMVQSKGEAHE